MKYYIRPIRVISGTVASSILYTSCCPTFIDEKDIAYLTESNKSLLNNSIAVPFSLNLKIDDYRYIRFLQKLSKDIIDNPSVAADFSKDSEVYLKKYNYDKKINLDDSLLKLILALGDSDILNTIKTNNVKEFLRLCKQRNLIKDIGFFDDEYYQEQIEILYKKDEFKKYTKMLNDKLSTKSLGPTGPPTYPPPPNIFVMAFFVAAIAAGAVVAIAMAVVILEAVRGPRNYSSLPNQEDLTINAWALKDGTNNFKATFDNEIEKYIDDIVDFIKTEEPLYFENYSEIQLRELLKYNFTTKE